VILRERSLWPRCRLLPRVSETVPPFDAMGVTDSVSPSRRRLAGGVACPPSLPSCPRLLWRLGVTSRGEGCTEWIHHDVDGVLSDRIFARTVHGICGDKSPRATVLSPRRCANLVCEVRRHRVHRVGEILPRSGDAGRSACSTAAFLHTPSRRG